MRKEERTIQILSCELQNDNFPYYQIKYQSEKILPYKSYDNILIIGAKNRGFIATIKNIENYTLDLYISHSDEEYMIGEIETQLVFSPITSIEGAAEIIKLTETFPPCHYENILSFEEKKEKITLLISLESHQKIMELCLLDIIESHLKNYDTVNTILQLNFYYHKIGIALEIDSMAGLEGIVICKRVVAQLKEIK